MATKKQSRAKVQGLVNPRGVTAVYGTPIDFKALPEKITIGRRVANGKFKLEAHYPAKHFNDKQTYVDKRKEGSYCRFYDKKSPFFIARTVWDATSQPGMHMIVKNRGETHRFIVTPKVDDPTKASVIGSYLVHRDNGDPVLCSGVIGELEAAGDDGDFKVTPYQNHGIRCPKFDSDKDELAGHIPKTFEYKKSTKPRGPRKTAADYCKPAHTFQHPTDIKKAEMIADMDDEMDEAVSCLNCGWDGSYEDLVFVDADGSGGGGYDFHLACPVCEDDEWLDDMMAESVDEPCFSCDGIGHWDDGDCGYCAGSGLMSDTLRAEMAMFNNEYFDADCGCFKKAEGKVWGEKLISGWSGSNLGKKKAEEEYKGESFRADFVPLNQGYWCSWCGDNEKSSLPQNCINYHYHHEPDNPSCNNKMCLTCYNQHQGSCYPCEENEQAAESMGDDGMRYSSHKLCPDCGATPTSAWIDPGRCECGRVMNPSQYTNISFGAEGLTGEEIFEKNDKLMDVYYEVVSKSWTHMEYEDIVEYPDGENIIDGPDYIINDRFLLGRRSDADIKAQLAKTNMKAETFEAPYAGAGALMGIKGDSALSSFTPTELTESSAIHGDFDQASLNYSGHQNLEVRAEGGRKALYTWRMTGKDCERCYEKIMEKHPDWEEHSTHRQEVVMDFLEGEFSQNFDEYCAEVMAELEGNWWESPEDDWWFKDAETLGKDSCCCGATKSKPCACMKTGAKCSGSCACSTKEARAESLVWCEHDNYENYDARWVNNVRIDSYKCKTCGMENDKEQHLDQDLFNQAEREGYKLYDYGEWEQDEPYKYEKDGIIIEIPVVKEEDIYRLDSPKTPPKWAKPLGLIGGLAAGYISAQMIDNTKE